MNATTPREPGHRLNFRKDDSRSGVLGASLVWMAMILAALGAITTYALPMITATDQTVIAGNQLLRANYLAEAGFRYAASLYLNTENEALGGDENSADDEKASLLKNVLDGARFVLPGGMGAFRIDVFPYWFSVPSDQNSRTITVELPGQVPPGFTLPNNGRIRFSNDSTLTSYSYRWARQDSNNPSRFRIRFNQRITPGEGDSAYLSLRPNSSQTVADGGSMTLSATGGGDFVPRRNGLIEVRGSTYRYENASISGNRVTLQNVTEGTLPLVVSTGDDVVFKKFAVIRSRGEVGAGIVAGARSYDYLVPISDSDREGEQVSVRLSDQSDLRDNFSWSSRNIIGVSQSVTVAGGSSTKMAIMKKIKNGTEGVFWLDKAPLINSQWTRNNRLLDYDVQVKVATGNDLLHASVGMLVRERRTSGTPEFLAVSYMRYYSPGPWNTDPTYWDGIDNRIKPGYPALGSNIDFYDGWFYDQGRVTCPFEHPRCVRPGSENQKLLLVLWQQKRSGSGYTRRWLAYKDVTQDMGVIGNQDQYDGNIANDGATMVIRVREGYHTAGGSGSTGTVKANDISVFFGDTSHANYGRDSNRSPDSKAYNIINTNTGDNHRARYKIGLPTNAARQWEPQWPPRRLRYWSPANDLFSRIQEPTQAYAYPTQWDAINPAVNDMDIFEMLSDGTVRCSDLATPDAGYYGSAEIGLFAQGHVDDSPGYRTVSFVDFAIRFLNTGHFKGGFMPAVRE